MRGKRILITGVTGKIACELAKELVKDNQVDGLARFSDPQMHRELENAWVRPIVKWRMASPLKWKKKSP